MVIRQIRLFLLILAGALFFLRCSDKSLFDGNNHLWCFPRAFVYEGKSAQGISIGDSAALRKSIAIHKDSSIYLIGLVTNPKPGIALQGTWKIGDQTIATGIFDTALFSYRKFIDTGHFHAFFIIQDHIGNSLSDSVTITVDAPIKKTTIDTLLSPVNGDTTVNPKEEILFRWHVFQSDPNDSVEAQLLLSNDSAKMTAIRSRIKTSFIFLNDPAIDFETTYYWRIAVKSLAGFVDTSRIFVFSTSTRPLVGKPVITSILDDTSIYITDSLAFFARATDPVSKIIEYAWDFDGNGIFDYSSDTSASCKYVYPDLGNYSAIFRVRDLDSQITLDTVRIGVNKIKLQLKFISSDTIIDFGGTVRCTIAVANVRGDFNFEIDTAHNGNFAKKGQNGKAASFSFCTDTATSWDSVALRVFSSYSDTISVGFKVSIRPRTLILNSIDSTDTTITLHWTKSVDGDFHEYRIYRSPTNTVDTNSQIIAAIPQAEIMSYTTSSSHALSSGYYRLYQRDKEGVMSSGSNIVFGHIKNTPPQAPVFITPAHDNDILWANAVLRWNKSVDLNEDSVSYEILLNRGATGFVSYAKGINDTSLQLRGFDTLAFNADIRLIASDSRGGRSAVVEVKNISFKQAQSGGMQIIPKGIFVDSSGNRATISYDFLMDTIEVTQRMYKAVMNDENPSSSKNDDQPVEKITWFQAIMYCNAMSKKAGFPDSAYAYSSISPTGETGFQTNLNVKAFRLPTEDEWEMAAHGGRNLAYATDDGSLSCAKANFDSCSIGKPVICGQYPANPYGIHEMTGNVYEWCQDVFIVGDNTRSDSRIDHFTGLGSGPGPGPGATIFRVVRGGAFDSKQLQVLAGARDGLQPVSGISRVGFRCVIPLK
jgi:formylglycine-generating enzyme required for sulfatase activity